MRLFKSCVLQTILICAVFSLEGRTFEQPAETVKGAVTLGKTGEPVHGATVILLGLGLHTTTDEDGQFVIKDVPLGTHQLLVEREHLTADRHEVIVVSGQTVTVSIPLTLSPIHESVTVTTSTRGAGTTFEQFNAITSLDLFELSKDLSGNLGETLQNEAGVTKRGMGPASSRPVIRGFDGDRVLIMQDGIRTGDLSSQSADHNVSIDPASLERIEIIKGPATLLYGSNAVGGIVNAITPQDSFRTSQPQGMKGTVVLDGGTANSQLGGNANIHYGKGDFLAWAAAGSRKTDDYATPIGHIENSKSKLSNGNAGIGWFGPNRFFSIGYGVETGRFGIPGAGDLHSHLHGEHEEEHEEGHEEEHEEEEFFIDNDHQRQNLRADFGFSEIKTNFLDSVRFTIQRINWDHNELEIDEGIESIGTAFTNDIYLFRTEFEQNHTSKLTGRFGVWYKHRDYLAVGEEAITPQTKQQSFAAFAYEELKLNSKTTISFGGRLEYNDYNPAQMEIEEHHDDHEEEEHHGHEEEHHDDHEEEEAPESTPRTFTGASGSIGARYDFSRTMALVGAFTSSSRAPALEELYAFGPHVGNLAFEVGNSNFDLERINGIDLGVKGRRTNAQFNFNLFHYDINNFVFPSFTEEIHDGLRVAEFQQTDARFIGFDGDLSLQLASNLWLKTGFGYVDATLTKIDQHAPRIPPFHGRIQIEVPVKNLTVIPEVIWSAKQEKIFQPGETETDSYSVLNLKAQYVLPTTHNVHIFAINAYNLTNKLYRMHTSFIKDLAPEIGRGIKFTYSMRFF